MYKCICSSKNETVSFLAAISRSDCRCIIARNIKFMCDKWRVEPQSLPYMCHKDRLYVHSQQELLEAEYVVAMVTELTNSIIGFNNEEIKEIIRCVNACVVVNTCVVYNIFLTAILIELLF